MSKDDSKLVSYKLKLRRPIPSKGVERKFCVGALAWLLFGIAWSIVLKDWQHLERSGSIIVIIGVLLAWKDLSSSIDDFKLYLQGEAVARSVTDTVPGIINKTIAEGNAATLVEKTSEEIREISELLIYRARTIEAGIIAFGTFIWGYGSLIGNCIVRFTA